MNKNIMYNNSIILIWRTLLWKIRERDLGKLLIVNGNKKKRKKKRGRRKQIQIQFEIIKVLFTFVNYAWN